MLSFSTAFCGACGQTHYDISSEAEVKLWKDLEAANASADSRAVSAIIAILRDCSAAKDCHAKHTIHHAIRLEGERMKLEQETFDLKVEIKDLKKGNERLPNERFDGRMENRDLGGKKEMLVGEKEEASLPRKLVCQACCESSGTRNSLCDGRYPCTECMAQGYTCFYKKCFKTRSGVRCKSSTCTMWHGEEGYRHGEF
ncbi:hypothetical protein BU16DRAFT_543643 [Lophium mytilinum]|uniref:Uncharacterized protein n=1 Tax=Lophium mytilinum TaxID=390894 RepID=A0A6A6QFM9_9PEZI|nr:hypothetical protein BU16DRAFT_543643 [Lophium mytilinum]